MSDGPSYVMPENVSRTLGRDAQRNNILAAKMIVDIVKTQESEVGDGTTTAALLAGKLLENAEKLLYRKIHPTVIVKGYRLAAEKAIQILNELAIPLESKEVLKQIAMTAMTGKGAEGSKDKLGGMIVSAVNQIANGKEVNLEDVKIQKIKGDGIGDSELIQGIVLDKERANIDMPSKILNSK